MDYQIARGSTSGRLMTEVIRLMGLGWQPQGGLCAVQVKAAGSMSISYEFYQAMVLVKAADGGSK